MGDLQDLLKILAPEEGKRKRRMREVLKRASIAKVYVTITPLEKAILFEALREKKNIASLSDLVKSIIHEWSCLRKVYKIMEDYNTKIDELMKEVEEIRKEVERVSRYLKEGRGE